jgi:hypothetical protein
MLREFQAAREGLTQQMREAFEEEPDFGPSSGPTVAVAEDETDSEPAASSETESAVAVLDPPEDEAQLEIDLTAAGNPPAISVTPEEGEATAAPEDEARPLGELVAAGVPDLGTSEATATEGEAPAAQLDQPASPAAPEEAKDEAATPAPPLQGTVPEAAATGGVAVDAPAEEPAWEPVAEGSEAAGTQPEPSVVEADAPFASVAADHETTAPVHVEEPRSE